MSILDRIKLVQAEAPRITIYGKQGIGKSTLAGQFPDPLFLLTEKNALVGSRYLGKFKSYEELWETVVELLESEALPFKTLVIDSVSELDELVKARTLEKSPLISKGNRPPETLAEAWGGYGAGFEKATSLHRALKYKLDKFQDRGVTVVYIAHLEIKTFKSPEEEDYNILSIRMNSDKSRVVYIDDVDAVLYCKESCHVTTTESKRNIVKGTGKHIISSYSNEAYVSKNRFNIKKDIPMSFEELSKYIPFFNTK